MIENLKFTAPMIIHWL